MIAAIYVRVSTEEQAEEGFSISAQLRALRDYCEKSNIKIYREYMDEGISGQKENRPAFQQMIKDAESKNFNIILVHKFDRFARKIELSHRVKAQLKKSSVNVISMTEPVEDSPIGFFQEGLLELLAEYYVRNLAKEVKKGMNERATKGLHMGIMPYGYYVENGTVKVNAEQAAIVKRVFELYLQGWGHLKIARFLNSNNIPSYTGKIGIWQTYNIAKILKNYCYIGKLNWDGNIYDANFPSIIDEEDFNLVQKYTGEKKEKYTYRGSNFDKFLLLGLLFCGECKKSMRIKVNNAGRKGEYYAYMCYYSNLYRNNCGSFRLHRHNLVDETVIEYIKNVAKKRIAAPKIEDKSSNSIDIFTDRIRKIDGEIDRAKKAYLAEVFTLEEYKSTKDKLEQEKAFLETEIENHNKNSENNKLEKLQLKLDNLMTAFEEAETIQEKKNILMKFITRIELCKDGTIDINFYID